MHDPDTVAFELRYPWRAYRKPHDEFQRTYRAPWLTIWHHDPSNYDDITCLWSPRVNREEKWFKHLVSDVAFLRRNDGTQDTDSLGRQRSEEGAVGWLLLWIERASFWHAGRPLRVCVLRRFLFDASFPGNRDDGWNFWNRESDEDVAASFANQYLRLTRPWWRHPRWHFWHWRFQLHPWQTLRRWLFSRCQGCGKRFAWGYSPLSTSWDPAPPKLFRSERHVYHFNCEPGRVPAPDDAPAVEAGP